jgi:hypothetical protein
MAGREVTGDVDVVCTFRRARWSCLLDSALVGFSGERKGEGKAGKRRTRYFLRCLWRVWLWCRSCSLGSSSGRGLVGHL